MHKEKSLPMYNKTDPVPPPTNSQSIPQVQTAAPKVQEVIKPAEISKTGLQGDDVIEKQKEIKKPRRCQTQEVVKANKEQPKMLSRDESQNLSLSSSMI